MCASPMREPGAPWELKKLSSEETRSVVQPQTPAAALLFQAPEFPVSQPQVSESGTQANRAVKERNGDTRPTAHKGSERDTERTGPAQAKQGGKKKKKAQKAGAKKGGDKPQDGDKDEKSPASGTGEDPQETSSVSENDSGESTTSVRRRRRRTRSEIQDGGAEGGDQVQSIKGSTRLEAKRVRRREGRKEHRRHSITEAEFLARRESVERQMVVRHEEDSDQIAVLEDGILVEHFVARRTNQSIVGNIYLGKVQNVLPSMEAAFIDIGKGRNAVLYAGEVNWDVLGMQGKPRRIETALSSGDNVLVQVSKDPIGHKGARLTSQITLAGRYLVFVPGSTILGISRKLPENERIRLKNILKKLVPEGAGVIVRTASEGATEEQLRDDVERLTRQWEKIEKKVATTRKAPVLLRGEPELVVRVVRDLFNEDVTTLTVQGNESWETVHEYVEELSPELLDRLEHWVGNEDVFDAKNVRSQLAKGMDRKVWLPSGGTLIIERTEALTVIDVNTGKFVGTGGTLEETVTRNNLEAAEEIVRQLRLRDIGGIIIIDFVDMVLEANRELVLRRLVESLGRDRTRHQVTEITSLGLVQMTRKRVGEGLVEAFSTTCEECEGRGFIVHDHPVDHASNVPVRPKRKPRVISDQRPRFERKIEERPPSQPSADSHVGEEKVKTALSAIAAATVVTTEENSAKDASTKSVPDQADFSQTILTKDDPLKGGAGDGGLASARFGATSPRVSREKKVRAVRHPQGQPQSQPQKTESPQDEPRVEPTSVHDIILPPASTSTKAVTRPVRRRAVVTGPLDTMQAGSVGRKEKDKGKSDEEARQKEELAREAVRDLLGG